MSEYLVVWRIALDANDARSATEEACKIMQDKDSTALVFGVCARCDCGEYHIVDEKEIDLLRKGGRHVH